MHDQQKQSSKLYEFKESGYQDFMLAVGFGKRYHKIDRDKLRALKAVDEWLDHLTERIERGQGMLIVGDVGCGKTTTMAYIARQIYGRFGKCRGYLVEDQFVPTAWEPGIAATQMRFVSTVSLLAMYFEKDRVATYRSAQILFLDDLGREHMSDFSAANFEDFIEHRYANKLCTFVSTNLSVEQLKTHEQFYRTFDRYREMCQLLTIDGDSMRMFGD